MGYLPGLVVNKVVVLVYNIWQDSLIQDHIKIAKVVI